MKRIFQLLFLTSIIVFSSCSKKTVVLHKPLPPGQAKKTSLPPGQMKKVTGSKSAAPYAPGQTKKAASGNSGSSASSKAPSKGNGGEKGKKK